MSKLATLKHFLINFISVLLIVFTILGLLLFFFAYVPGKKLYSQGIKIKDQISSLKIAAADKDLVQVQKEIDILNSQINNFSNDYNKLSYYSRLPFLKPYYQDGLALISSGTNALQAGSIVVKAIEPYKDFLGLKGAATDSAKTTQDRITFLTQSVESLTPHFSAIEKNIASIDDSLNSIDPSRYPDSFQNINIRQTLLKTRELISEAHKFVKNGQPLLAKTSWLLGKDSPRKYFIMFQNDAELRPTGGFWTAYGIMKVDKGKITPVLSSDIYSLDAKYNSTIPAPRPIKAYHINVPYLNLRDMNLSPDFPEDITSFLDKYYKIMGNSEKIDVVVAIDTQVLVDLVKVLGRIGVPGFGNFSADPDKRCDGCPQIIYQFEWLAGRPRNFIEKDRKGFLTPVMHSLLSNAMGSEKSKITPIAQAMLNDIYQKHILFYFTDPILQTAAAAANISGSLASVDKNIDYLHLNDANMSSAKSNLFIRQKIKHEIISNNGTVEHKVIVTYTNPSKASNCNLEKGDLCLNAAKYRDWFRFYVPIGSKFIKMTGSEVEPVLYEESGRQVFEGFYGNKYPLYAESNIKTSIQYQSSVPASSNYTLLLQKQPGTKPIDYELWLNGQKIEQFSWNSDKTIKLSL